MRSAILFGTAISLIALPAMATAQMGEYHGPTPPVTMPMPPMVKPPVVMPMPPMVKPPMMPGMGMNPGGMNPGGMRPPVIINRPGFGGSGLGYGFQLPTFWMAPTYTITNYGNYRLPKPRNGNRWSRYYDGAVQTDQYGRVIDWREDMNWGRDDRGYGQGYDRDYNDRNGDRPLDYGSQYPNDGRVYTGYDDRQVTENDYRNYDDRNDGGSYDRRDTQSGSRYPEPGYAPRTDRRDTRDTRRGRTYDDSELARICRRDNGVGGAVIGGVVGGIAGNRIGGRGDRLAGSLIGAGVGAIAGAAIDQNEDKRQCDSYFRRMDASRRGPSYGGGYGGGYAPAPQGYPQQTYPQQGYGPNYQGGYYYPTPAPQVTVINIPGNGGGSSTSTTTTTSTYYETVAVKRPVVRKRVHKHRPRCGCR